MNRSQWVALVGVVWLMLGVTSPVEALPGFFASKGSAKRQSFSTHVVVMKDGGTSVVSVMTDTEGPEAPFALVLAVPSDVKQSQLRVLKRGAVERLEELTAPRFFEFWEQDPCDTSEQEQIWERDLSASKSKDFLGGAKLLGSTKKTRKELRLHLETDFRTAGVEYRLSVVGSTIATWLKKKGYTVPSGVNTEQHDGKWVVAEVDTRKVQLGGRGETLLSPIRFETKQPYAIASTIGLPHVAGKHELLVYVLDPKQRFEAANYPNRYPPTNLQADFKLKERMGEFYVALHDKMLSKEKNSVLTEYVWSTTGCGQPCTNSPLHLHELLTLGADVFERGVSSTDKNPKPPPRTEEEQAKYDAMSKPERFQLDKADREVARRRALIDRRGDYVLTRLHYRFDKATLPKALELRPGAAKQGGVSIPQGPEGTLPQGVQGGGNTFQTRVVHLHPNKKVVKCDAPKRYRWGKPPRTFRGNRKIWVADQLASRRRSQVNLSEVLLTSVPSLGIQAIKKPEAALEPAVAVAPTEKPGSCRVQHSSSGGWLWSVIGLAAVLFVRRRRRL